MRGKYEKKKSRKGRGLWIVLILALLIVAAVGIAARAEREDPDFVPPGTEPVSTALQTEAQVQEEETRQPTETEPSCLFHLGSDVVITEYISYTGAFMEDRTDEVLTDILAIRVTNNGDACIQTMDITLLAGDTQAQFSLSTLFPGDSVIVLEKNRMAYSTAPEFTQAETSSVALFESRPGLCEDKLDIQCLNGVINITNISGEDLTGDILIYYKNYVAGTYYGGITYRIRLEGGLKAGEVRQGAAAHFNPDNSTVVFVTCN